MEPLIQAFRCSLPDELNDVLEQYITSLENADFEALLQTPEAQNLLQNDPENEYDDSQTWTAFLDKRLESLSSSQDQNATSTKEPLASRAHALFAVGYGALLAFLQSNVTGPSLPFSSARLVFHNTISNDARKVTEIRQDLVAGLTVDAVAAYRLTPNIELLCLAKAILSSHVILDNITVSRWARLRSNFVHQRLLSEQASTLEDQIYQDLDLAQEMLSTTPDIPANAQVHLLIEQASIDTYYGFDKRARSALDKAAQKQKFEFAITGILGKRTKFQQFDISQLVVLAKSADSDSNSHQSPTKTSEALSGPANLDLNDDTLLESISFTEKPTSTTDVRDTSTLPPSLANLDPADQPRLQAIDSIILLALASSITNTSPANGLTREETLPYATRVLDGGSSNWQVYTQALLVRSRIEGYKSRTVERGLLQLQAVVDQVIADTTSTVTNESQTEVEVKPTSFLPKAKEDESASASERLRYIFQLASPPRWDLEAELAQRWIQLGGLRSALEIYERLEMWAEAALCHAATENEDRGRRLVRKQLYHATSGQDDFTAGDDDDEKWEGKEREPAPADAPRLFSILGDIDNDPKMYERAWEVSGQKYARAQRSLGRYYFTAKDYVHAAEGYAKSLRVNQLNQASWFALGCALLELDQFEKAVEAFTRCVQLDETDAEAWSNLAAALLKQEPAVDSAQTQPTNDESDEFDAEPKPRSTDPQRKKQDALRALKRAATLKHDSYRIWENVLIVATSISPPDYLSIISAQKQLINLRSKTVGEQSVDVEIMELLVQHIVSTSDGYDATKPGYERLLVDMVDNQIVPLITSSRALWQMVARLAVWRNKPASALDAQEKAWRVVTNQPGWDTESEARWNDVVDATVSLCDAYESLGPREKNEGLGAGEGVLVAKDWKFKARSAVRGIMGRGKTSWEDTEGWERLVGAMEGLRG